VFFVLSKTIGFLAAPSNVLIVAGLVGLGLIWTRFRRAGHVLVVASIVLLAVAGFSPLGNWLLLPLEQRFPPWDPSHGAPSGIVILGGAIAPEVSAARDAVALEDAAERITVAAELARRYPEARIIFSGGSGTLGHSDWVEAPFAVRELQALGVDRDRITAEEQSRNTVENAVFARLIATPKPGERWLLITSAYHMPRAMAAFNAAGFVVEAYPVDWRTSGPGDALRPFSMLSDGLRRVDIATREWVGLAVYRLTGISRSLFPGP
jgi:uncharacterized SAM-binding protein YcdF (DUF218 family)